MKNHGPQTAPQTAPHSAARSAPEVGPESSPGKLNHTDHTSTLPAAPSGHTPEPLGLKRRHFMGTALALDAAALLAACGGGGGGGDSGSTNTSGSSSSSGSGSSSASSSASSSGSSSSSSSASSSSSGSGSAALPNPPWLVTTFAGTGSNLVLIDGTGGSATFSTPNGVCVDSNGNVYVTDGSFQRIRKITPAGVVSIIAGSGSGGFTNGTGWGASFDNPWGIAVDTSGHLFVSETINSDLRKITPAGVVSTLAGSRANGFLDGTGTGAQFNQPRGVAIDASGNLFVADTFNHRIRKVTPAGVVTTLAGTGTSGTANGIGSMASFSRPFGVAVDATGALYVADSNNHLIRKITPAGVVSTLSGAGTAGSANGTGTMASFNSPVDVAVDANGEVYVADYNNNLIRKITPEGLVTTLAGSGVAGSANGTGTNASFKSPFGINMDSSGNLFVADSGNNMIRKITPI